MPGRHPKDVFLQAKRASFVLQPTHHTTLPRDKSQNILGNSTLIVVSNRKTATPEETHAERKPPSAKA